MHIHADAKLRSEVQPPLGTIVTLFIMGMIYRAALDTLIPNPLTILEEWHSQHTLWITLIRRKCLQSLCLASCLPCATHRHPRPVARWKGPSRASLRSLSPLLRIILARVNSSTDQLSYQDVLPYSAQVRQLMRLAGEFREENIALPSAAILDINRCSFP
jgi:hypothetical protein